MRLTDTQVSFVRLDPRTKLYLLLVVNIVMLGSATDGAALHAKNILAVISCFLLFLCGKKRQSVLFAVIYAAAQILQLTLTRSLAGISGILMRTACQMITRFVPGTITAYYLIATTTVGEFMAAMEKMKMPQAIVIPLGVIFRFVPTIRVEYLAIRDAMNIRGVGSGKNLIAAMEYRMVPLIMSVVRIGDELSAAALTRGMSSRRKRTNMCRLGFGRWDMLMILAVTLIAAVYLISAVL